MGYRLSRKAEEDVLQIYADGLREFGVTQAERYQAGLAETLGFLAEYPEAARERPEIRQRSRVFRYKAHLVFYRKDGANIFIQRVRHGREDWWSSADDPESDGWQG